MTVQMEDFFFYWPMEDKDCAHYLDIKLWKMHNFWHTSSNIFFSKKREQSFFKMWQFAQQVWYSWAGNLLTVTKNVSPRLFVCWTLLQRCGFFVCLTTSGTSLLLSTVFSFVNYQQLFYTFKTHYSCLLCFFSSIIHCLALAKYLTQWTNSNHIYLKIHDLW